MQQKIKSSVGSGAQARNRRGLSFEDKYVALQFENQKLKRRIREIRAVLHYWRRRLLQYQAERDGCQEKARERGSHAL